VTVGQDATPPRSLVWATLVDVLPMDRVVEQKDGYLLVRSPKNPTHYWGNLLLFAQPPLAGAARVWERSFEVEFGDEPRVRHRTFAWDRTDRAVGLAQEEFVSRGYALEESIGLVAGQRQVRAHRRENRDVLIRALEPASGVDEESWEAVLELQVANRDQRHTEESYRLFARMRQRDLRAHFRIGRGAWYVAIDPGCGTVVGSCGVVVTGERGRFQAVDTALAYRRLGICSRLVVEAARRSAEAHGAERFVIVADPGYHALALYESLGFSREEHVFGVCRHPD
jgi:ribosomal protein S18 acetylase RimI-like enzyme